MGEEKERKKMSSLGSERKTKKRSSMESEKKRRRKKSLFEWSKGEEVNLLKKLVEFDTKNMAREELYPFLRSNGSPLAEVPKIQIFNKTQQLKKEYLGRKLELRKMRMQYMKLDEEEEDDERDECFELSNRLWGEVETESGSTSSKALDVCSRSYFEGFFEGHGLDIQLFTPSFVQTTKKDVDHLFSLQHHHFLVKAKLKAQLAQLKFDLIQAPVNNPTNQ